MGIERNGSGYVCPTENIAISELDHPRPKEYRKYTVPMRKTRARAEHYKTDAEKFGEFLEQKKKIDPLHEQKEAHKKQIARIQRAVNIHQYVESGLYFAMCSLVSEQWAKDFQTKLRKEAEERYGE